MVKMRVLVVFLLGFSLTEGRNVTKCELKEKVQGVIGPLMKKGKSGGNTVNDTVAVGEFFLLPIYKIQLKCSKL